MSYWNLAAITAAVIVCATFAYLAIRWRKAPAAFRARSIIAVASVVAGMLIGLWGFHAIGGTVAVVPGSTGSAVASPSAAPSATLSPAGSLASPASMPSTSAFVVTPCVRGAVSTQEVGKAVLVGYVQWEYPVQPHLQEMFAAVCRRSDPQGSSASCAALFLGRHIVGLDLEYGGASRCIAYDEVAEFCDLDYMAKDEALCKRAYEVREERRRELGR
jgi:transposase